MHSEPQCLETKYLSHEGKTGTDCKSQLPDFANFDQIHRWLQLEMQSKKSFTVNLKLQQQLQVSANVDDLGDQFRAQ